MRPKLLSICIPTYNRCEILDNTLKLLFENADFENDKIEIIVSDNCSTDKTSDIISKYPLVVYHRNAENIKDGNYSIVLNYATGLYLKLVNDTISFKPGALKTLLDKIEEHKVNQNNLFFYDNNYFNKNCHKILNSVGDYLFEVSYFSTWIVNFGCWREDFLLIENKDRYANLQFAQVDWTYKIVRNNKKTIIFFNNLYDLKIQPKKGGYDLFYAFMVNYLFVLKQASIPLLYFEIEKYRLYRYFFLHWFFILKKNKIKEFDFRLNQFDVFKILIKKYWYELYIYPFFIWSWIKNECKTFSK
jgi:abequosyltransferase